MRQRWVFFVLTILILAGQPVAGQQAEADLLIVPGERVSAVTLGMSINQTRAAINTMLWLWSSLSESSDPCLPALGPRPPDERCVVHRWDEPRRRLILFIFFVGPPDNERAVLIWAVGSSVYQTAEGIGNRILATEATRAYGPPTYVGRNLTYIPGRQLILPSDNAVWHSWTGKGIAVVVVREDGTVLATAVFRAQ